MGYTIRRNLRTQVQYGGFDHTIFGCESRDQYDHVVKGVIGYEKNISFTETGDLGLGLSVYVLEKNGKYLRQKTSEESLAFIGQLFINKGFVIEEVNNQNYFIVKEPF